MLPRRLAAVGWCDSCFKHMQVRIPCSSAPSCSVLTQRLVPDPLIQDGGGNTPLHICARKGHADIAKTLLNETCGTHLINSLAHRP